MFLTGALLLSLSQPADSQAKGTSDEAYSSSTRRIPLCTYVLENFDSTTDPDGSSDCVQCYLEPREQCQVVPQVLCSPSLPGLGTGCPECPSPDQSEVILTEYVDCRQQQSDGVNPDNQTPQPSSQDDDSGDNPRPKRKTEIETVCRDYTPPPCDPLEKSCRDLSENGPLVVCYEKPVVNNGGQDLLPGSSASRSSRSVCLRKVVKKKSKKRTTDEGCSCSSGSPSNPPLGDPVTQKQVCQTIQKKYCVKSQEKVCERTTSASCALNSQQDTADTTSPTFVLECKELIDIPTVHLL